jgi:small-conductance mechanosensitive channel
MGFMRGVNTVIFLSMAVIIAYINFFTDYLDAYGSLLSKILNSVLIILIFYLIQNIIEGVIRSKISDTKERYYVRKTILTLISILVLVSLIAVWFKETANIVVAYGLLSAGVAIALQDLLKSIAGGMILFISRPFVAGDRIQVEDIIGDVLDIKNFSTTIMEIREWVDGDQYTGRIIHLPNSFILNKAIKNYTRDFSFIWDEVQIMLVCGSNLKKAEDIILKVSKEMTMDYENSAKNELVRMGEKYFIDSYDVETKLFMKQADGGMDIRIRYVLEPRERRSIRHQLIERLIEALEAEDDIILGTTTSIDIMSTSRIKVEGLNIPK